MKKIIYLAPERPPVDSVELTGIDLIGAFIPTESVSMFKPEMDVDRLVQALQKTVNDFYIVGGRLVKDGGRLLLGHFDQGICVEIVESTKKSPPRVEETFSMDGYEPIAQPLLQSPEDLWNNPFCAVRITRFSDGIVQAALYMNHILADGGGLVQFVFAWSKHYEGIAGEPPLLDKDILRKLIKPQQQPTRKGGIIAKPYADDYQPADLVMCLFSEVRLSPEKHQALRVAVKASYGKAFSFNDFIQGLLLKAHGLSLSSADDAMTFGTTIFNARFVEGSGIPVPFFGNAALYRTLRIKLSELRSTPLEVLANQFCELGEPDPEAIWQDMGYLESQYKMGNFEPHSGFGFSEFLLPFRNGGIYIHNNLVRGSQFPTFGGNFVASNHLRHPFIGLRTVLVLANYEGGITLKLAVPKEQKDAFIHHWSRLVEETLNMAMV